MAGHKPLTLKTEKVLIGSDEKTEVEIVVEAGKELPRKYLRLAESFKENDTNRGY